MRGRFWTVALLAALGSTVVSEAQSWDLWQAYASTVISPEGRVVDHQGGDRTTSEGQAYAMFFSLVANDRPRFDKLLGWTRDNLAGGDLTARLPGWQWGKAADGQWRLLDKNAASDADLWLSYSLFEAGRLWEDQRYTRLGESLAKRIAAEEVAQLPGVGAMLLPGPQGFHPQPDMWVLNPSYTPLPVLAGLSRFDSTGPWTAIARNVPELLKAASRRGFAMDWVAYSTKGGFAPAAGPGQSASGGSYDAIRVYLWAGMTDGATTGHRAVLQALGGMADYLNAHPLPPERISAEGDTLAANGPIGFSAALLPYLEALGKTRALDEQQSRVNAGRNVATRLYGQTQAYYDQNLVMFGKGWEQRRFRFGSEGELKVTWKKA